MKASALIPPRSESTRMPEKNLRFLLGSELVRHSSEHALLAGVFDHIAAVARKPGVEVLLKQCLAEDAVPRCRRLEL